MKYLYITSLLLLFSVPLKAQYTEEEEQYAPMSTPAGAGDETPTERNTADLSQQSFYQRLVYGGNFQLSFGTVTFVEVSPRVGYMVTEDYIAGLGANFIYSRIGEGFYYPGSPSSEFIVYGGHLYNTYMVPFKPLPVVVHAEFEMLNYDVFNRNSPESKREWVPGAYLGGGLYQRFNGGGGIYFMALYNVLYDPDRSLYQSPWSLRASFLF